MSKRPSPANTRFPSPLSTTSSPHSEEEKIALIATHFRSIMEILGLDLKNDSLSKTPERVAYMYVREIFSGLDVDRFPDVSFFKEEIHHEHQPDMVFAKVGFVSFCEHHFLPMTGSACIAYLPESKLIGLSKLPRLVHFFAKRPQVQERLTAQIADSLSLLLETENIAVSIHAQHFCVTARGVKDENSRTITNVLRGQFHSNENLRREFFEGINRQDPI